MILFSAVVPWWFPSVVFTPFNGDATGCASAAAWGSEVLPVLSIALPVFGLILTGGIAGKAGFLGRDATGARGR